MGLNTRERILVSVQIFFIVGLAWQLALTSEGKPTFVIVASLLAIGAVGVGRVQVRHTRINAELEINKALQESERAAHELAADADVRTRRELAFWIHGELQSALVTAARSLRQDGSVEAADRLSDINDKIIRMMAHNLYPTQLEVSLYLAMSDLCHERAELTMSDNLSPDSFKNLDTVLVPFNARLAVHRIIEEAITNAEKKPDTTKISVNVKAENYYIHISVLDNGADFDAEQKQSLGFSLIKSYVRQFNGYWAINNLDDGVLLTATLALPVFETVETVVPPTFVSVFRKMKE